tara:strand:+ start:802 stop:1026 length:225 start_codon:yes stop_codon:yes gene_type:complete
MMDVMISSGSESNLAKEGIPGMGKFAVNESEPRSIGGSKCHVGPHIAVDELGSGEERNKNHEDRVQCGSIKSVK